MNTSIATPQAPTVSTTVHAKQVEKALSMLRMAQTEHDRADSDHKWANHCRANEKFYIAEAIKYLDGTYDPKPTP